LLISILVGIFLRHKKLPDHDLLEDFLKGSGIDEESVVFPVSMRLGADICARVNCKSFWWQPGNVTREIFDHFIQEYPYLKKDWKPLAQEVGVTHVVASKHELSLITWDYDFSHLKKIQENDHFVAYQVKETELTKDN
jgi:hypothetical protein